jgi:hypothetical protein
MNKLAIGGMEKRCFADLRRRTVALRPIGEKRPRSLLPTLALGVSAMRRRRSLRRWRDATCFASLSDKLPPRDE